MGKHVAKRKPVIDTAKLRNTAAGAASESAEAVSESAVRFARFVINRQEGLTAPFTGSLSYNKKLPGSVELYIAAACLLISAVLSAFRYRYWVFTCISLVMVFACGSDLIIPTIKKLFRLNVFNQELIMFLAVFGCFSIGRPAAGALVISAFRLSKYAAAIIHEDSNVSLEVNLPQTVLCGEPGEQVEKPVSEIMPGEIIHVGRDELIPLDGIVEQGISAVEHDNLSYIALNENVRTGSYVYAGDYNASAPLEIKVLRAAGDTTLKLLQRRDNAREGRRSSAEKRIDTLAAILSPVLMLTGLVLIILSIFLENIGAPVIRTGIALLIISCNSFDFSRMLYAYVYAAFRRIGIAASGRAVIEKLPETDVFVFGKTGVLTDGSFVLNDVRGIGCSKEDVLKFAAAAEKYSDHPIARFLKNTVKIDSEYSVRPIEELPGKGISSFVNGRLICVGNAGYMEDHSVSFPASERQGMVLHVSVDNNYAGCFVLNERTAEGAYECIEDLKAGGAGRIAVLTGSSLSSTKQVIKDLNVDIHKSDLTPEEKAVTIRYLGTVKRAGSYLAYVGKSPDSDGVAENADITYLTGTEDIYSGLQHADLFSFVNDITVVGESFKKSLKIGRILSFGTLVPLITDAAALALLIPGMIGLSVFAAAHFAAAIFAYLIIRGTDR